MSKKLSPENKRDLLPVMVRAFVPPKSKAQMSRKPFIGPSEWTLIFDTETTTTPDQASRFGVYQLRKDDFLDEAGIFFNPKTLNDEEQGTLKRYALEKNLKFMT